jgi:Fe(3+) dicitrate transport protein
MDDDAYRMLDGRLQFTADGAPGQSGQPRRQRRSVERLSAGRDPSRALDADPGTAVRIHRSRASRLSPAPIPAAASAPPGSSSRAWRSGFPGSACSTSSTRSSACWPASTRASIRRGRGRTQRPRRASTTRPACATCATLVSAEAIAYFNDYDNLVGTCTLSSGGGCDVGDQFDGGEVEMYGLELSATAELTAEFAASPLRATYTYSKSGVPERLRQRLRRVGHSAAGRRAAVPARAPAAAGRRPRGPALAYRSHRLPTWTACG